MLVIGAWMILASPGGAKGVGIANGFAFVLLNGVFLSVSGLSNPETGSLRMPLFVLVTASLMAFAYHVSVGTSIRPGLRPFWDAIFRFQRCDSGRSAARHLRTRFRWPESPQGGHYGT